MDLGLCQRDALLFSMEAGLQLGVIDAVRVVLEGNDALGVLGKSRNPGDIGRLR